MESQSAFMGYTDFSTVDGVRLALKTVALIRASGTERLLFNGRGNPWGVAKINA